jgi:antitoxin component of RelBE/YafQ-DinJ toxin-antitoxin module
MATRTVRLDDEAEEALQQIRDATGLPISEALKEGLRALLDQVKQDSTRRPFELYRSLDPGPGGEAIASSDNVRAGVAKAIRRKLSR